MSRRILIWSMYLQFTRGYYENFKCNSAETEQHRQWNFSVGAYEVEHDILEERVLEQLSYHIPRYEMGKYNDITPEERELLEKDIAFIRSKVELWKLKSYGD